MSAETHEQRLLQLTETISAARGCSREAALLQAYSTMVEENARELGLALFIIGQRWQLEAVFSRMKQHAKSDAKATPKEPA